MHLFINCLDILFEQSEFEDSFYREQLAGHARLLLPD